MRFIILVLVMLISSCTTTGKKSTRPAGFLGERGNHLPV